jgi:D-3-phosphoglycerate dehydrogenase
MGFTVLVTDKLSEEGLALLQAAPDVAVDVRLKPPADELRAAAAMCDGWIVRSGTKITADLIEAASKLKAVARAGAGVDNIDVEAATRKGVVVMNTPGGNSVAAAEHTIGMIFALARNIARGDASLRRKAWERSKLMGVELEGKTLGVIGLGRIGREVAVRGRGLKMKVVGSDPYLSESRAKEMDIQLAEVGEVLETSDVVTVHVPLSDETRGLIGRDELARMKPSAMVINCARGGIVDEEALAEALREGRIAGAAVDVFESEPPADSPLLALDNVVLTPHLGASTKEAQVSVAVQAAQQMIAALKEERYTNAVNMPVTDMALYKRLAPFLHVAEKLGLLVGQLLTERMQEVKVELSGPVSEGEESITIAVLKGLLSRLEEAVNFVNAAHIAEERGIRVAKMSTAAGGDFANLVRVEATSGKQTVSAAGTCFGDKQERIVEINGHYFDARPEGVLLVVSNRDVPGVVGKIGTILGDGSVNIAEYQLGRREKGRDALSVISLDMEADVGVLKALEALPEILGVTQVKL